MHNLALCTWCLQNYALHWVSSQNPGLMEDNDLVELKIQQLPNMVLTFWVELIIVWTESWWWCSFSPPESSSTQFGRRALPNEDFGRLQAQAQPRFPDDGDDGDEDHLHDDVLLLVIMIMIMTNRMIRKRIIIRKWWYGMPHFTNLEVCLTLFKTPLTPSSSFWTFGNFRPLRGHLLGYYKFCSSFWT